jgi:hypothetical protein
MGAEMHKHCPLNAQIRKCWSKCLLICVANHDSARVPRTQLWLQPAVDYSAQSWLAADGEASVDMTFGLLFLETLLLVL